MVETSHFMMMSTVAMRRGSRRPAARIPPAAERSPSTRRSGAPPVGEESHVLCNGPPAAVARGIEADVAQGELTHQCIRGPVAARAGDAAVGHAAVGIDQNGDADGA